MNFLQLNTTNEIFNDDLFKEDFMTILDTSTQDKRLEHNFAFSESELLFQEISAFPSTELPSESGKTSKKVKSAEMTRKEKNRLASKRCRERKM